jgi:hypothetical protein
MHGSAGLFQVMAWRWLSWLAAYVVILGLFAVLLQRGAALWWMGLNLWAAFLHYAYDGMIWKLRRPETARALGIETAGLARTADSRAVEAARQPPPSEAVTIS